MNKKGKFKIKLKKICNSIAALFKSCIESLKPKNQYKYAYIELSQEDLSDTNIKTYNPEKNNFFNSNINKQFNNIKDIESSNESDNSFSSDDDDLFHTARNEDIYDLETRSLLL